MINVSFLASSFMIVTSTIYLSCFKLSLTVKIKVSYINTMYRPVWRAAVRAMLVITLEKK